MQQPILITQQKLILGLTIVCESSSFLLKISIQILCILRGLYSVSMLGVLCLSDIESLALFAVFRTLQGFKLIILVILMPFLCIQVCRNA